MKLLLLLSLLLWFPLFAAEAPPKTPAQPATEQEKKDDQTTETPSEEVVEVQVETKTPPPKKGALTEEEKMFCQRNMQRVIHKLTELTEKEKAVFVKRIEQESAICKKNEKCACDIFPYMLSEIEKRIATRVAQPQSFSEAYAEQKSKSQPRNTQAMLAEAEILEQKGRKLKKIGIPLLAVGIPVTLYGLIASTASFYHYSQCYYDDNISNTACSYNYRRNGFAISGAIAFLIGVPALVGGAILTGRGNAKLGDAQEIRTKTKYSLFVAPILDPKKKMYGATLSLRF